MKKILIPITNRAHVARMKLLLRELKLSPHLEIIDVEFTLEGKTMQERAANFAHFFGEALDTHLPDIVIIRGDRFEMLPAAMLAAYCGVKIAHIEGGDLSGAIDNKVRHAITHLADVHFVTTPEAARRVIALGADPEKVYNFGSLDAEFAANVPINAVRKMGYFVTSFHPIPGEDGEKIRMATDQFKRDNPDIEEVRIVSNQDYGVAYGNEEFGPEDYINLLRMAFFCVGNSSSFLKEASYLGVPVVDVGERQNNRLKPSSVLHVPYDERAIYLGMEYQSKRGHYADDHTYYKPGTSSKIASIIETL